MDIVTEYIAGTPVRLTAPFDFGFIKRYGEPFTVVANNEGSGNLCVGVEADGRRYFVKFAGAPRVGFDPALIPESIQYLRDAGRMYADLAHECLITFVKGEEVGGGYANVFEWVDAECIGYPDPDARRRFLNLLDVHKLCAFRDILEFHRFVAERGYVAIDFYADQMLYDFINNRIS